jgi:hypothetical protein
MKDDLPWLLDLVIIWCKIKEGEVESSKPISSSSRLIKKSPGPGRLAVGGNSQPKQGPDITAI